jgi:hypothetical protein
MEKCGSTWEAGIMYGMDVIAWNNGELHKLEVVQNNS